ncbi:MAG: tetratricopeptide repeat protein [Acidobacteriota bacterium]
MKFDKTKAMRDAERYLAQGKIRSAIGEYEQVIQNDPRDFGTLNILGDLYIRTSSKAQAVSCYNSVAEHYSDLGFAQKAIAVYNKISKLEPNSVEVSAKLAELYKEKGSVREARSHYVTLAEHYQKTGKKVEALAIWKQIALLDQANTEVFSNIAKTHLEEGQADEAIEAYIECGNRYSTQKKHDLALGCFEKALEIKADDAKALGAFVSAKFAVGRPDEAVEKLTGLLAAQPFNREILNLLIDCFVASGNLGEAEKTVIKLVEQEPANYPKFLELAALYLENDDLVSTSRILSMSSEHLLVGGQASEFNSLVRNILERDADHLEALRLLVRYCAWEKDEGGFRDALVRLAGIAKASGCADDERYALSQLTMIFPHETEYAERLRQINEEFGFAAEEVGESLFDKQFVGREPAANDLVTDEVDVPVVFETNGADFEIVETETEFFAEADEIFAPELETFHGDVVDEVDAIAEPAEAEADLEPSGEQKLQKEVESIRFYIESGYLELADKAIHELRGEFGERDEITGLREHYERETGQTTSVAAEAEVEVEADPEVEHAAITTGSFELGELRSELGLEEPEAADESDYETHYHTAVAYQEMGLIEQAIREFQDAVGIVSPSDGTRRFFQCANLLGHCFMEQGMPKLALKWFNRTLESEGLMEEEKQALWYEVAAAHELDGDIENAAKFFELVYAENVDFRDVRDRVKTVMAHH